MVKGWLDSEGQARERVHDIAWSDERTPDASGRVPPVENTVDLDLGTYRNDVGSTVLGTVWRDPDFDASRKAFYYVRVLEIPTPRHSVFDALALGLDPRKIEGAATIINKGISEKAGRDELYRMQRSLRREYEDITGHNNGFDYI